VVPVTVSPLGVEGTCVPPPVVVPVTGGDWPDEPALFDALTVNEYDVAAARPVMVVDVPDTVTGLAPLRRTV
jgi:hypothetical protein